MKNIKPLEKLSRSALEALVKLVVSNSVLIPSVVGRRFYYELRQAGYAVIVGNGYQIDADALDDGSLMSAIGLIPKHKKR